MKGVKCPFCKKVQNQPAIKTWKYLKTVHVMMYKCKCGKGFRYYVSTKNTWTIPKSK